MRLRTTVTTLAMAFAGTLTAGLLAAPATAADGGFAPADQATLTPGVQTYTAGSGQCTANFVFDDAVGDLYLGFAAHCAGTGGSTDTNGCNVDSLPLGTKVTFNRGGSLLGSGEKLGGGTLAYSSWEAMNRVGTTDANACAYNDFALVKINDADTGKVNPSIPVFGGPNGIDTNGSNAGDQFYSYGNSSLRGGVTTLSPKYGSSLGSSGGGWTHALYTATPGVPGDSGSAFLSENGAAVGTLSTLGIAPTPASNNIGDLSHELSFAQRHSEIDGLDLVLGTEPFNPSPVG